jgi:uncharacterized LabA/DUF88 family protein
LFTYVEGLGSIQLAIAYGCQKHNEAEGFRFALEQIGFETKYKSPNMDGKAGILRANWDVTITLDITNSIERLDCVVLGSADKRLVPLISWCKERGVKVIVLASGIGQSVERMASMSIEIPESLLENT